jgi:NitT/TauT family transport system substrate-binding protein
MYGCALYMQRVTRALVLVATGALGNPVLAEEIVVTQYPVNPSGFAFSVAMGKGFFKQAGADVTGIIGSGGGGTTIRTMISGNLVFGEAALAAVIPAIQAGADIKIIASTIDTAAEYVFAARLDSPVNTAKDLRGKKMAYTNPGSTSQAMDLMLLETVGLTANDVTLVKAGGAGEMLAALDAGLVDVAPVSQPLWAQVSSRLKQIAAVSDLPRPATGAVAITTGKGAATRGDFLRAVLKARRMAVEFMRSNPDEAAMYIAKDYNVTPAVAKSALLFLLGTEAKAGLPYFGTGRFHPQAIETMIQAMKLVGAIKGDPDWRKMIDERFLPDDLKGGGVVMK